MIKRVHVKVKEEVKVLSPKLKFECKEQKILETLHVLGIKELKSSIFLKSKSKVWGLVKNFDFNFNLNADLNECCFR